jgi:hypothetical protein
MNFLTKSQIKMNGITFFIFHKGELTELGVTQSRTYAIVFVIRIFLTIS